jgi:O-Antigen ligase
MMDTTVVEPSSNPKLSLASRLLIGCGVLLYVMFVSGANACLYEHGQLPFKPRDFTLGMSAMCFLLALSQRLSFAPLALACLFLPTLRVVDSALLVRFATQADGGQAGLVATLLAVLIVSTVSVLLLATPVGIITLRRASMGVVTMLCGSILYEAMGFAKYTAIPGRAAGFLTQPNESIICVCLVLGIALTLCEHFWTNAVLIAVAAMGVGLTLSRSGMVVFAVMVMTFLALNMRQHFSKILVLIALSVPASLVGVTYLMNSASSRNFGTDTNAKARVEAIFGGSVDKMESAERMKDLTDGWEAVTKSPMLGYGTGCSTSKWQPHNGWVGVWLELGLGGVLLLAALLLSLSVVCVRARGRGIYCLIPLWMFTVFSQNLLENAAYISTAAVLAFWVTTGRFRLALHRPASH